MQKNQPAAKDLNRVFKKSVSPYSKGLALHPHLFLAELYNRASELKALDKIVWQLTQAQEEVAKKNYQKLSPLLQDIRDALNGNPKLSWWNLVTISIGRAFSSREKEDEEDKNYAEKKYLMEISTILTDVIRMYQSPNTKLLLDIRLTTLEVESRLVELEKIPSSSAELQETLEYLASEFLLVDREWKNAGSIGAKIWGNTLDVIELIRKTNQLMDIQSTLLTTNPVAYEQIIKGKYAQNILSRIEEILLLSPISPLIERGLRDDSQLNALAALFVHFPTLVERIEFIDFISLLNLLEQCYVDDANPDKTRPKIFSSPLLKQLVATKNEIFSELAAKPNAQSHTKSFSSNQQTPYDLKKRLTQENDLYNLCSMLRFQAIDFQPPKKNPSQIQGECLKRMRVLSHSSQPRELDNLLKSLSSEETSTRYYLLQEVILDQFIYWRKHGIF